jgi:DNA topoisomerase-1
MAKPLVIVESPAKAKTLGRFLGSNYRVEASFGHIRDLPESAADVPKEIKEKEWGRLGVDVESDFAPYYVVPGAKKKQVTHLKAALKDASELLLATDPDREGESISWHLAQVLKPKVPVHRIVFHEITEEAVKEALDHPSAVNENLVRAQESRRILDRLYGYTLSPVLWKKVQTGLSAGRVQSVAVRLIVEREEERRAFRTAEYWDLEATLRGEGREFVATLVRINDQRIASGKDFDAATGALKNQNARLLDGPATRVLVDAVRANVPWTVTSVEQKPGVERPAPPFTTSTLTQEASRKLGYSTERTMQIAQRLFQGVDGNEAGGLITYHRTDSTTLSEKALGESARVIREMFGPDYHAGPRRYQTRVKNAQEAHEAIRPTDFRLAPSQLEGALDSDDLKVYELIWKRTMASQMVDARVLRTSIEIAADGPSGETAFLTAGGKAIEFAGFRRAYVEGSDDPAAELEEQEAILPQMKVGDRIHRDGAPGATGVTLLDAVPKQHETTPPARFTEASLIKELERLGIGRPSTYAPTIATIARRGYVFRQGKALVPSFTAFAVTSLLREHFGDFVETDFTAEMEDDLDEISRGERESVAFLREFYYGDKKHRGLLPAVERGAEKADYPVLDLGTDPDTGEPVRVRIGRFGPFIQVGDGGPGRTASLPDDIAPADLAVSKALDLVRAKAEGPRTIGVDPATGMNVYVMNGRFGAYVQLGETPEPAPKVKGRSKAAKAARAAEPAAKPKRASLQAGMTDSTITLDQALTLLSLPRDVGLHPDDGQPIVTNFGRFGPYVKHGDEFRSLESDEDVFSISFEAALALIRAPKQSRRRQGAQKKTLREIAQDGTTLKVLAGRYGPYVTDGTTNASIPRNMSPEAITYPQAQELLAARRDAAPAPRRGGFTRRAASGGARKATRRKAAGA